MRLVLVCLLAVLTGSAAVEAAADRTSALQRAQVWMPTDIPAMDIRKGPDRTDGFEFLQVVHCDYQAEDLSGASPKFGCEADGIPGDDDLKVKYGGSNGEVYGEVAASRLLWALGFGADAMYPVRIVCRGCPALPGSVLRVDGVSRLFDPASVERKMEELEGEEIADRWSWRELDDVSEEAGGAPQAHRDALKLLAVFMQHSDSKAEQQRLICLDSDPDAGDAESRAPESRDCARPFMLMQDVGLTFGRANAFNDNALTGMNLAEWSRTPVWKDETQCVGNLPRSAAGTLDDPLISEEGRAFLADLLMQLTDPQIHDLFETARVTLRPRDPRHPRSGFPTVDEWVAAFKAKRDQIVERRCA